MAVGVRGFLQLNYYKSLLTYLSLTASIGLDRFHFLYFFFFQASIGYFSGTTVMLRV